MSPKFLPLGPSPIATKTINTTADNSTYPPSGCNGLTLATQVNAYTISADFANLATCTNTANGFGIDDGIGGDPMTSAATGDFNVNIDFLTIQADGYVGTVPLPPTVWLFGSGLFGLISLARRK